MNQHLILVVEDDPPVRNLITTTLQTHGYPFLSAPNGNSALAEASSHNPDIILLDLGLPDIDGIDVIRKVRTFAMTPIIVISARSEDTDKIQALDAGADDYLTKPFSVEELLARLRVIQRRLAFMKNEPESQTEFDNGPLKIDFYGQTVSVNGQEVHLTQTEYKLLTVLARNEGKVLTYQYITREVWGSAWKNNLSNLRVHMASLRKKLEKDQNIHALIQTHVGIGYRMLKIDE